MKSLLMCCIREDGFFYPQLGLGYIAAYSRTRGHDVQILDCTQKRMSFDDLERYLHKNIHDVYGLTVFTFTGRSVAKTVKMIRRIRPDATIVVGGHLVSAIPEKTFSFFPEVNFGVAGEGEEPFYRLLEAISAGKSPKDVPGLVYLSGGHHRVNKPAFFKDLDSFGYPAWDLMDPRDYFSAFSRYKRTAPMVFSRGCPFRCTFCTASLVGGGRFRLRSIEHIMGEIKSLRDSFGVNTIAIQTEGIGSNRRFMERFCRAVIEDGMKMEFTIPPGMRLNMLDRDLLVLMKQAGFSPMITVGIESGSDRVLRLMGKHLTTDEVRQQVALLNGCGFKPTGNFIIGFPGETRDEVRQTIDFSLELRIWQAAYHPFMPIPGAKVTEDLMKSGELTHDFDFLGVTTMDNTVYAAAGFTPEDLRIIQRKAIFRFFLRPRIILFLLHDRDRLMFAALKMKQFVLQFLSSLWSTVGKITGLARGYGYNKNKKY